MASSSREVDDSISPERGLWCHICEHMPLPEKEEMASLIGFALIQSNESLWAEKATLQSILYEVGCTPRRATGRKLFQDALLFSQSHYEVNEALVYPADVLKLFLCHNFSAADQSRAQVEEVQAAIQKENALLEQAVASLQKAVDEATSVVLECSAPTHSTSPKAASKLPSKTSSGHLAPSSTSSTRSRPALPISTKEEERGAGKPSSTAQPFSPPMNGKGKFRSRLLDAQSELFLSEDFSR
eukprot:gene6347-6999_t